MAFVSYHSLKGDYGVMTSPPRWNVVGWAIAMFGTVATAVPAIGLSVWVYLRGLGAIDHLTALVDHIS